MARVRIALVLLLFAACAREKPRPNVLLITLDTFRSDRIGAQAPNLARLAQQGVTFDAAISPVPLTLPAHASLLTGALPPHHGLRNNGAGVLPADTPTLASALHEAGYRTGAFIGSFVLDHRFGLDRGFETYDDEIARDPNAETDALAAERRGDVVLARALKWLGRRDERPFFAWVHLYDAHAPYAPPAPYPQTYDGEIRYVDALVGQLLAKIDRSDTIVAILGDHGEGLGEHDELTHGVLLYDGTLRVPWIIAAPGIDAPHVALPVSTVDLAPTLAELAGVTLRSSDGRSLAPFLRDRKAPEAKLVYSETEYPATFGWGPLAAMRNANLKLISASTPELYDVARDPHETRNVLNDERRAYRELSNAIETTRANAENAAAATVDAETRAKLASLGYVAPTSAQPTAPRAPKSFITLFRAFEEATTQLNRGDTRAAITILERIVKEDPANAVFRTTLGRAYAKAGDTKRAIALQQEAVGAAPNDLDAWYNLAVSLQENGRASEADVAIDEVLRRDPRRAEAYNLRGVVRIEQGRVEEAEATFRKALELDRRNARAWNNLGNAQRARGRPADALGSYQEALRLAPDYLDALNGTGAVLVQTGRPAEAVPYFDQLLKAEPRFHEARLNRAVALAMAGQRDAARAELRILLDDPTVAAAQKQAAAGLLQQIGG